MKFWQLACVCAVLSGCTKRNPAVCCTTEADCMAIGLPVGSTCGDGLQCVHNDCIPPTTCQANSDCEAPTPVCVVSAGVCGECASATECGDRVCGDDHLCRDCAADTECATGFCSPATHTCKGATITPKYLPTACDAPATNDLTFLVDTTLDTSMDGICTGGIVAQSGGPEICVLHHRSVSIPNAVTVTVIGGRPIAFVADEELSIAGNLRLNAALTQSGAGGGLTSPAGTANTGSRGGGGAGFFTAGGHGGLQSAGSVNNGGPPIDALTLASFVGGQRAQPDSGGGGGGAALLISCHGAVSVSGLLAANGGGGLAGYVNGATSYGGGGGGAGGQFLLQGRSLSVTGQVFANGGSAGSGKASNATAGKNGRDGLESTACASGGQAGIDSGVGGAGGCIGQIPTNGGPITAAGATGGGGGGSVGFLRTATPAGVTPTISPSAVSPAFSANETVETH